MRDLGADGISQELQLHNLRKTEHYSLEKDYDLPIDFETGRGIENAEAADQSYFSFLPTPKTAAERCHGPPPRLP